MSINALSSNSGQQTVYHIGTTEVLLLFSAIGLFIVIKTHQLDFVLADIIYDHFQWHYQKDFVTEQLLHRAGRYFVILIYLGLIYKLLSKFIMGNDSTGAYHLSVLLLTIALSVIIVAALKRVLDVDCPWDLLRYGGSKHYFPFFNHPLDYLPSGHCFPASHASVGFSWLALFFYFKVSKKPSASKKTAFMALGSAILLGIVFGGAQQLRGAHFLSHDVASLIICLVTAISVYSLAYQGKKERLK